MTNVRVAVLGSSGRMGTMVSRAVESERGFVLHSGIARSTPMEEAVGADVLVDFTDGAGAMEHSRWAIERGVPIVIGASGLTDRDVSEIRRLVEAHPESCVCIVSNFSLSAMLLKRLAAAVANDYQQAEIVEYYGTHKKDSPSATSLDIARTVADARSSPFVSDDVDSRSRGEEIGGIPIHALRLNGYLSREEIIFGNAGETLTIAFETSSRDAFMPSVLRAVKLATRMTGLHLGLECVFDCEAAISG